MSRRRSHFRSEILTFLLLLSLSSLASCRKHHLDLKVSHFLAFRSSFVAHQPNKTSPMFRQDETRTSFPVSMFGFLQGGILNVTVTSLAITPAAQANSLLMFTLDRTLSDATNPYLDSKRDLCNKNQDIDDPNDHTSVARFTFDFEKKM